MFWVEFGWSYFLCHQDSWDEGNGSSADLAASSTSSFPSVPMWLGIFMNFIFMLENEILKIIWWILWMMYWSENLFRIADKEDSESVMMRNLFCGEFVLSISFRQWRMAVISVIFIRTLNYRSLRKLIMKWVKWSLIPMEWNLCRTFYHQALS